MIFVDRDVLVMADQLLPRCPEKNLQTLRPKGEKPIFQRLSIRTRPSALRLPAPHLHSDGLYPTPIGSSDRPSKLERLSRHRSARDFEFKVRTHGIDQERTAQRKHSSILHVFHCPSKIVLLQTPVSVFETTHRAVALETVERKGVNGCGIESALLGHYPRFNSVDRPDNVMLPSFPCGKPPVFVRRRRRNEPPFVFHILHNVSQRFTVCHH